MKSLSVSVVLASALLGACATTTVPAPGMVVGKFVNFECQGGRFSARAAEDGKSVRVRGLHGAAELELKGNGVYEGDGYKLVTQSPTGVSLMHDGKPNGTKCLVV